MSVYFIQAEDGGPIKIGYSDDPRKRLSQLQTSHHGKLVVKRLIKSGTRETENELHERFAEYRMKGEWFRPHPDLARYARCIASGPEVDERKQARVDQLKHQEFGDLMVDLFRKSKQRSNLTLPEQLHLASLVGADAYELQDALILPVLELRLAYLELYAQVNVAVRVDDLRREIKQEKARLTRESAYVSAPLRSVS